MGQNTIDTIMKRMVANPPLSTTTAKNLSNHMVGGELAYLFNDSFVTVQDKKLTLDNDDF